MHLRTWQRWESAAEPPFIPLQLMRYKYGFLPGWPGFRLKGDVIYTPANEAVHRNQIDAFWWLLRLKTDGLHLDHPELVQLIYQHTHIA